VPDRYSDRRTNQYARALQGQDILSKPILGLPCRPVVSEADLAAWLGASIQPEPPAILPERKGDAEAQSHNSNAAQAKEQSEDDAASPAEAAILMAWMNGYAQAFKDSTGRVLKDQDAIRVICKNTSCSYRKGRAAYQALPYPGLRNPPPGEK
jgi:hypothetical protein